jgi:hypothetical protein
MFKSHRQVLGYVGEKVNGRDPADVADGALPQKNESNNGRNE